jgi:hypothetical protein
MVAHGEDFVEGVLVEVDVIHPAKMAGGGALELEAARPQGRCGARYSQAGTSSVDSGRQEFPEALSQFIKK